jgi:micrococcal nuclease
MNTLIRRLLACALLATTLLTAEAIEPSADSALVNASIINVVDGDTITVRLGERTESVRLIGIDTPESRFNKRAALQAERSEKDVRTILNLGKQAYAALRSLAPKGSMVRLEFDVERRDRYDRLLAYVYSHDGVMLNEEMISRGYAQLLTIPPNVRYVERFTKALKKSQQAGRGLWSSGGFRN